MPLQHTRLRVPPKTKVVDQVFGTPYFIGWLATVWPIKLEISDLINTTSTNKISLGSLL